MRQITLGDGAGTYDFTGAPPGHILFGSPGLSGSAFLPSEIGAYSLGPLPWTDAGPLISGNFATAVDQSFSYAGPSGALSGTAHWSLIKDHSPNPDLIGDLSIADSTVDGFAPGATAHIDLVLAFKYPDSPFLDEIAASGAQTWAVISAGEIVPQTGVISEPGTLALLGIALVAAWWSRRGVSAFTGRREVV